MPQMDIGSFLTNLQTFWVCLLVFIIPFINGPVTGFTVQATTVFNRIFALNFFIVKNSINVVRAAASDVFVVLAAAFRR